MLSRTTALAITACLAACKTQPPARMSPTTALRDVPDLDASAIVSLDVFPRDSARVDTQPDAMSSAVRCELIPREVSAPVLDEGNPRVRRACRAIETRRNAIIETHAGAAHVAEVTEALRLPPCTPDSHGAWTLDLVDFESTNPTVHHVHPRTGPRAFQGHVMPVFVRADGAVLRAHESAFVGVNASGTRVLVTRTHDVNHDGTLELGFVLEVDGVRTDAGEVVLTVREHEIVRMTCPAP